MLGARAAEGEAGDGRLLGGDDPAGAAQPAAREGGRLSFEAFGYAFEVLSHDPTLIERIGEVLPPGWRPLASGPVKARYEVTRDGRITLDGEEVLKPGAGVDPLRPLASAIHHQLAQHAPAHVFIHAGVVAVGNRAIVIPGSSMSGKSTLVDELVRAGATYFSDEYAVVDRDGMIWPYPKALSLRFDWNTRSVRAPFAVSEGQIIRRPARAALIVVTRYEEGASWRPQRLTSGQGALTLLEHTVSARSRPREAIAAACRLAVGARTVAGPRGEAGPVARRLLVLDRVKRDSRCS
jgi:hypothetical protein